MSYVAPPPSTLGSEADGVDEWCSGDMRDVHLAKPRLLSNELIVASVPAYMYPATTKICEENAKESVFGLLTVTNFKLAFVPHQKHHQRASELAAHQENQFLDKHDVTLNNIDYIYQIVDKSTKRKKLELTQRVSSRIAALHIVCKNFRLLKYSFRQTSADKDYGKIVTSALARFAYASRHELSFACCYKEPYYNTVKTGVTMFASKNDWARELIRCGATEWQVVSTDALPQLQHQRIQGKYTLPPNFVIPKCCAIDRFLDQSRAFCDSRSAFWVYGYGCAALLRMAELKPSVQDTKVENITLELVRKCHPEKKSPRILQLTERLPSIQDVQRAYLKFRRICTAEGPQQFLQHDAKFLSLLEKSNWLFYVSLCMRYACEAAEDLRSGVTCVLQESNGRDMCCLVSSLTQIILDPLYRTIDGFQSLIQKEWIALEHPFQTRLGHVRPSAEGVEESPVFLLFLDCVWQLLQQYPDEFEYSQTYLTTVWDSCFLPIFDTFQFDCEAGRMRAVRDQGLVLRPVWDWGEQFAEKDKVFFTNPFYQRKQENFNRKSVAIPAGAVMLPGLAQPNRAAQRFTINPQLFVTQSTIPKDRFLKPRQSMSELSVWEQCYYRWIPILEIKYGGFPQIDLYHRLLLSNIAKLQRALELQDYDDLPDVYYERTKETRPNDNNGGGKRNSIELVDGVERRRKSLPQVAANGVGTARLLSSISSFFPFSVNMGETQQLIDILTNSNEIIMEGSIMERLSIA